MGSDVALKQYSEQELPAFNAAIASALGTLHPLVRSVGEHISGAGGKRLRPLLCKLCAQSFLKDTSQNLADVTNLAISLELLHAATLLHDDILDGADKRRGRPAAHKVFGLAPTVLAGDALLALSNKVVAQYGDARLSACLAEAVIQTATGEIQEIALLNSIDHGFEGYLEVIIGKSAWLLRGACELGTVWAGATPEQIEAACVFGENLGIAFQIVDDALDFAPSSKDTGKPVGGDLREGKYTPPIVFYVESLSAVEKAAFLEKFQQGIWTDEEVQGISHTIAQDGFADKGCAMAQPYLEKAQQALAVFPEGTAKELLQQVIYYVATRKK